MQERMLGFRIIRLTSTPQEFYTKGLPIESGLHNRNGVNRPLTMMTVHCTDEHKKTRRPPPGVCRCVDRYLTTGQTLPCE